MSINFSYDKADDGGTEESEGPELREDIEDRHGIEQVHSGRTSVDKAYIDWTEKKYTFHLSGKDPFHLPFLRVQRICEWYVNEGAGMTQKQVCREYYKTFEKRLTHDYLKRMLKALDVDKNTIPVAPHRIEGKTVDENVKRWREKDEALIETQYRAKETRRWKNRYKKLHAKYRSYEDLFEDGIAQLRENGVCSPTWKVAEPTISGGEPISIVTLLGDWHIGLSVEVEENVFNSEIAQGRVQAFVDQMVSFFQDYRRPIREGHILLLGDMIDGAMGDMHDQQYIHQDLHGIDQILAASDLIAEAIRSIYEYVPMEKMCVHAVGGNHGRARKDRREDPRRLPELLTYEIAKLKCDDGIDWNISREVTVDFEVGQTKIIGTHGDRAPRKIRELAWSHQEGDAENFLVCSGHKHSDQIDAATDHNVMHVRNGSLCGVDDYAKRQLAKISRPAQMFVEIHEDGPQPGRTFYL